MGKEIEVEGKELKLKNSNGDIVIVPKDKAALVREKFAEIDDIISKFPAMGEEAKCGGVEKDKAKNGLIVKKEELDGKEISDSPDSMRTYDKNSMDAKAYALEQRAAGTSGQDSKFKPNIASMAYDPLTSTVVVKQGGKLEKVNNLASDDFRNQYGDVAMLKLIRTGKPLKYDTEKRSIIE